MRRDVIRTLAALGALCFGAARADTLKLISANSSDAITLDGRLDEAIWDRAVLVRLVQQSPYPGHATPYETEVRVILAGDRLYFGFICRDPDVRKISVHSMQRDDLMTGDDKAMTDTKRQAHRKVVEMVLKSKKTEEGNGQKKPIAGIGS
ncbi:MAG TPA: hypothetical protein VN736_03510 [Candidatus Limnocylindrales bacterium]|nr:hypothetical protein [Candidatus Limnocylindrales bacterium]